MNVAGLDLIGRVSYIVPRDIAELDVIDGASHRVAGRRRARRHRLSLSLRCGMSLGATSTAESFHRVGRRGGSPSSTEPFIVPRDVAVHDVIEGISCVVRLDVAGGVVIGRIFHRVAGRRRDVAWTLLRLDSGWAWLGVSWSFLD